MPPNTRFPVNQPWLRARPATNYVSRLIVTLVLGFGLFRGLRPEAGNAGSRGDLSHILSFVAHTFARLSPHQKLDLLKKREREGCIYCFLFRGFPKPCSAQSMKSVKAMKAMKATKAMKDTKAMKAMKAKKAGLTRFGSRHWKRQAWLLLTCCHCDSVTVVAERLVKPGTSFYS